jgi:hypothetical protein
MLVLVILYSHVIFSEPVTMSSVACFDSTIFFRIISTNDTISEKKYIEHKICVLNTQNFWGDFFISGYPANLT